MTTGLRPQQLAQLGGQLDDMPLRQPRGGALAGRAEQRRLGEAGERVPPGLTGDVDVLLGEPTQVIPVGARPGQPPVVAGPLVQGEQLVDEHLPGPAVPQQHVMGDREPVAPVAQAQQQQPEQRRVGQVEPPGTGGRHQLGDPRVPFGRVQPAQVDLGQPGRPVRADELHRTAEPVAGETRPQAGVAGQQRGRRQAQPVGVDPVVEVEGDLRGVDVQLAHVIAGVEVQPLLQR